MSRVEQGNSHFSRRQFLRGSLGAGVVAGASLFGVDTQIPLSELVRPNRNEFTENLIIAKEKAQKVLAGYKREEIKSSYRQKGSVSEVSLELEKEGQMILEMSGEKTLDVSLRPFLIHFQDITFLAPVVQAKEFSNIAIQLGIHPPGRQTFYVEELFPGGHEDVYFPPLTFKGKTIRGTPMIERLVGPLIGRRGDCVSDPFNDVPLYETVSFKERLVPGTNVALPDGNLVVQWDRICSSEDMDITDIAERTGRYFDYDSTIFKEYDDAGEYVDGVYQGPFHKKHTLTTPMKFGMHVMQVAMKDNLIHPGSNVNLYSSFAYDFTPLADRHNANLRVDDSDTSDVGVERLNAYNTLGLRERIREGGRRTEDKIIYAIAKRLNLAE